MTQVQLLQTAQGTAMAVVADNLSALKSDQALLAAFVGTGNPDTDYPAFKTTFARELQSYRAAAQLDTRATGPVTSAAPAPASAAGASAATAGLPPSIFASLPPEMQKKLLQSAGNRPAAAPAAAPAPIPTAEPKAEPVQA